MVLAYLNYLGMFKDTHVCRHRVPPAHDPKPQPPFLLPKPPFLPAKLVPKQLLAQPTAPLTNRTPEQQQLMFSQLRSGGFHEPAASAERLRRGLTATWRHPSSKSEGFRALTSSCAWDRASRCTQMEQTFSFWFCSPPFSLITIFKASSPRNVGSVTTTLVHANSSALIMWWSREQSTATAVLQHNRTSLHAAVPHGSEHPQQPHRLLHEIATCLGKIHAVRAEARHVTGSFVLLFLKMLPT